MISSKLKDITAPCLIKAYVKYLSDYLMCWNFTWIEDKMTFISFFTNVQKTRQVRKNPEQRDALPN